MLNDAVKPVLQLIARANYCSENIHFGWPRFFVMDSQKLIRPTFVHSTGERCFHKSICLLGTSWCPTVNERMNRAKTPSSCGTCFYKYSILVFLNISKNYQRKFDQSSRFFPPPLRFFSSYNTLSDIVWWIWECWGQHMITTGYTDHRIELNRTS